MLSNDEINFQRLDSAAEEMEYGEADGNFDAIIINDDLDKAYQQLKEFMLPKIPVLNDP